MSRGQPQIDIVFDLSTNSILNVTAREKTAKSEEKIKIKNTNNCLSEDDIERMVVKVEKYKAEDDANENRIEAKHVLESYCYSMKDSIISPKVEVKILNSSEVEVKILKK